MASQALNTHSSTVACTAKRGEKVTTALNGPSDNTTSVSAIVVLAVEVEGNRSSSGSDPIRCLSSDVLPAPVVPTNKTRV